MSVIRIERTHRLDHAHVRAEVESLAAELEHKLHGRYRWAGDTLEFSRVGASGHIRVLPTSIVIEIKLALALIPLKSTIERTLNEYLDQHMA